MAEPTSSSIDSKKGRRCCHCKQIKSFSEYSRDVNGPAGLYRGCKKCQSGRNKVRYQKNKEAICKRTRLHYRKKRTDPEFKKKEWSRMLQIKYNIDAEIYERMFLAQKGVCWICKNPETVKGQHGLRMRVHPLILE